MGSSVKVDQKGRLKIPTALLSTLNQHGTEFYITSEDGDSVRIYPMPVWSQVEERLKQLCSQDRNSEKLLARAKFFGSAVTVDKQGRVLIPIGLRKIAQMRGAVHILDYLPYLEVWNHARFLKRLKHTPSTGQEEKTLDQFISALNLPWTVQPKRRAERASEASRRLGMHGRLHRHPSRHAIRAVQEVARPSEHASMN